MTSACEVKTIITMLAKLLRKFTLLRVRFQRIRRVCSAMIGRELRFAQSLREEWRCRIYTSVAVTSPDAMAQPARAAADSRSLGGLTEFGAVEEEKKAGPTGWLRWLWGSSTPEEPASPAAVPTRTGNSSLRPFHIRSFALAASAGITPSDSL